MPEFDHSGALSLLLSYLLTVSQLIVTDVTTEVNKITEVICATEMCRIDSISCRETDGDGTAGLLLYASFRYVLDYRGRL